MPVEKPTKDERLHLWRPPHKRWGDTVPAIKIAVAKGNGDYEERAVHPEIEGACFLHPRPKPRVTPASKNRTPREGTGNKGLWVRADVSDTEAVRIYGKGILTLLGKPSPEDVAKGIPFNTEVMDAMLDEQISARIERLGKL